MHTIKEAVSGALLAGLAAGVLWGVISNDAEQGARAGAVIAVLPLTLGAAVQLVVIVESARARAANHWRIARGPASEVIERLPALPVARPAADRRGELPEPERVRLIPVVSHAGAVMAAEPASVIEDGKETARVVSVERQPKMIDEVREDDLIFFVQGIELRGHARSGWAGVTFPSGARCDSTMHTQLINCLLKVGAIQGRAKGYAGRLTMTPGEIGERLGLPVQVAEPAGAA